VRRVANVKTSKPIEWISMRYEADCWLVLLFLVHALFSKIRVAGGDHGQELRAALSDLQLFRSYRPLR
jgi:hypothetical protein